MFNAIIATTRKDLALMAKDPGALALLFVMPLLFIVVMSLAMEKVYEPSSGLLVIAVADEDHGAFAAEFIRELKATSRFEVVTDDEGKPLDRAAAERMIVKRRQQIALVIPAGLSDALFDALSGKTSKARDVFLVTDPSLSPDVLSPLRGAINGLTQQSAFRSMATAGIDAIARLLTAIGGAAPEDFVRELKRRVTETGSGNSSFVTVKEQMPAGMVIERRPNSVEQNVPGYTLLGLFFIATQLANNILEEKRLGTFRRLLAAPTPRWALMAGKIIAFMAINIVQVAILFAFGVWVLPRLGGPGMSSAPIPKGSSW